jgi:hypothetical protein
MTVWLGCPLRSQARPEGSELEHAPTLLHGVTGVFQGVTGVLNRAGRSGPEHSPLYMVITVKICVVKMFKQ